MDDAVLLRRPRYLVTACVALRFWIQCVLFALFLVVTCATVSEADSYRDAVSAVYRDEYDLAARLFHPLAEQGHAGAQSYLGVLYVNGQGLLQNYEIARRWYRRAAQQGHARAQGNLGVLYASGQGLPKDVMRAYMWLTVAIPGSRGDDVKTAIRNQRRVASDMTAEQIAQAQDMARRCRETQFAQCE